MNVTKRIPILMYHQVLTEAELNQAPLQMNPAYTVTLERFSRQMGYLKENGYRTLLLDELLADNFDTVKSVAITFDDGWRDNWSNALPVMKDLAVRSTVFVVSDFVGMPGYMTWEQLREMSVAGMAIQSHTASHRPLGELSDKEIRMELVTSKERIEDRIGLAVDFISMPQGVYDNRVVTIAMESGYKALCTSEPVVAHRLTAMPVLGRVNISGQVGMKTYSHLARGDSRTLFPIRAAKKGKNLVKNLLGYTLYRKMYDLYYGGGRKAV